MTRDFQYSFVNASFDSRTRLLSLSVSVENETVLSPNRFEKQNKQIARYRAHGISFNLLSCCTLKLK